MIVTVAIDSFKGSLTSMEAGKAAADGIRREHPDAEIFVRPIADGGEGTVDALVEGMGGEFCYADVTGPLGDKVNAKYGIVKSSFTAIMEMSAASGITLVPPDKRNPMHTTSYGVGEMINHAIDMGCRNFIMGIGGSATNDGGIGMLQALGFDILDSLGNNVPFGAEGVGKIHTISVGNVNPVLKECTFRIACDVTNPLCGDNGCSAVFGPQKGADSEMVKLMDASLLRYSEIVSRIYPSSDMNYPGAGAAGGLGFAFRSFLNAELTGGIELVLTSTALEDYVKKSDIVVTGEGRLDSQTVMGKAPAGVASIAKKYGKTVIAFSGSVTSDARVCNSHGIDAFFPILRSVCTLEEAMNHDNAYNNMVDTAEQVFRLI